MSAVKTEKESSEMSGREWFNIVFRDTVELRDCYVVEIRDDSDPDIAKNLLDGAIQAAGAYYTHYPLNSSLVGFAFYVQEGAPNPLEDAVKKYHANAVRISKSSRTDLKGPIRVRAKQPGTSVASSSRGYAIKKEEEVETVKKEEDDTVKKEEAMIKVEEEWDV